MLQLRQEKCDSMTLLAAAAHETPITIFACQLVPAAFGHARSILFNKTILRLPIDGARSCA